MYKFLILSAVLALTACGPAEDDAAVLPAAEELAASARQAGPLEAAGFESEAESASTKLARVLADQPSDIQARFEARHPQQTLEFFGIEPGMTVVEALPGGGWYSRILVPFLGTEGRLIGTNYALEMWPLFPFGGEEFMAQMRQWPEQFPGLAKDWCSQDCAAVSTFWLGSLPDKPDASADAVLLVRALHNLARFNAEHGYLDAALADLHRVLKPGGTLGVVQHWARDDMPDDWADGNNGYLKRQFVIDALTAAGFELVAESGINANPNDRPSVDESVWRLPPSLRLPPEVEDAAAVRADYEAIGESNRMTLKFRKPE